MISCLQNEKKYIECFIVNTDFSPKHNVIKYNNIYDGEVFVRLNSSILDNSQKVNNM